MPTTEQQRRDRGRALHRSKRKKVEEPTVVWAPLCALTPGHICLYTLLRLFAYVLVPQPRLLPPPHVRSNGLVTKWPNLCLRRPGVSFSLSSWTGFLSSSEITYWLGWGLKSLGWEPWKEGAWPQENLGFLSLAPGFLLTLSGSLFIT